MTDVNAKVPLVLLHGWGVNRAIFEAAPSLLLQLSERFEAHVLDLPGYGHDLSYTGEYGLIEVASRILDQAPPRAIWVGWSLGATIAMQCALLDSDRMICLQLISPTPRFMFDQDWQFGMRPEPLAELRRAFDSGYENGLKRFLLLQTSNRSLVRGCFEAVISLPCPSLPTIERSLSLLETTDLRSQINEMKVPTQTIFGHADQIIYPAASLELAKRLSHRQLVADCQGSSLAAKTEVENDRCPSYRPVVQLGGGHLSFLEYPKQYMKELDEFAGAMGG